MKVIGLGAPQSVRVRFRAIEMDVLVDVLRGVRASATLDAARVHAAPGAPVRSVDDRHDRLRSIEALLLQLEDQPHASERGANVFGDTDLLCDVVGEGARQAIARLAAAHTRYVDHGSVDARDGLLDASGAAHAWVATLISFDRVDRGWPDA